MTCNFIEKETPTQVLSCEYHKMFENSFFYGTPPVAASENGWRISNSTWEVFVQQNLEKRKICKDILCVVNEDVK